MGESIYKIKRSFIIPLIAVVVLLFILLLISLFDKQAWEIVILAFLFVISLAVGVEAVRRVIIVSDQGLTLKRFFRRKDFGWAEITDLAIVIIKKKVYFLLTTTRGFYIFSNLMENHASLVRIIVEKLGEDKVEVQVKGYLDHPIERLSLIVMSWVAVAVVVAVIILKISGF